MLKLSTTSRRPLVLQAHKPIPIATYIPKFDEGYNPNRRFDPDTERAEQSKLKALYKKEKKGAIRELRKDNKFLAGEEVKRKAEADATYNKKVSSRRWGYLLRSRLIRYPRTDRQNHGLTTGREGRGMCQPILFLGAL